MDIEGMNKYEMARMLQTQLARFGIKVKIWDLERMSWRETNEALGYVLGCRGRTRGQWRRERVELQIILDDEEIEYELKN